MLLRFYPIRTQFKSRRVFFDCGRSLHSSILLKPVPLGWCWLMKRKQLLYMFESKIEEGEVYQMSFSLVVPQTISNGVVPI
ncbi:hypothetical protein L195_g038782, partial [Trifolium pratense]